MIRGVSAIAFGDGQGFTQNSTLYTVTLVDVANDTLISKAVVNHTYFVSPPVIGGVAGWRAFTEGCCRLSPPSHINNPDVGIRITTLVNLGVPTAQSPVSGISPIVDCPKSALCLFQVPAIAPPSQTISYRFANTTEASDGQGFFRQPGQHPAASPDPVIDFTTGIYSWNPTGATLAPAGTNTLYSTQVIVEGRIGAALVSWIAVDFFIRLSDTASPDRPPVFVAPTLPEGTILTTTVGAAPVTFDVAASDPDTGDTVTLGMLGMPVDATFAPTAGNPATGTFTWTPASAGAAILTLTAQD